MWQRQLVWDLNEETLAAGRKAIIAKCASDHHLSESTIYRTAKEFGWASGRKERVDKGGTTLSPEAINMMAGYIRVTRRENKGSIAPVERAMHFVADNGRMTMEQVSVSTAQRNLRQKQMDKKCQNAATPYTEMRSLHPNHVHEVDASTCIQYYLDETGLAIMRSDEFYKNKLENFKKIKVPLQRYILTDHFSGSFFVKYYLHAGETAENLFDFLCSAWEVKSDKRFAFRGAPQLILMDGGSRAKAKAMGPAFWEGMEITIPPGTPGNSRRQGSVEVMHRIWEEWFETGLRIDPATTIEDLNRKAFEYALWFNAAKKHTRHKETRLALWNLITREQLREIPARSVMQDLLDKPEIDRTVSAGKISYEGKEFSTRGLGIPNNSKVKIIKNLMKWKDSIIIVAWDNRRFEIKSTEKLPATQGGFSANAQIIGQGYKAQPETITQQAAKKLDMLAYGDTKPDRKKQIPFQGLNVFEGHPDKIPNLAVFPRSGRTIDVEAKVITAELPIRELFAKLKGHMTPALNKALRAEFGETINAARLKDVAQEIIETGSFTSSETAPLRAEM